MRKAKKITGKSIQAWRLGLNSEIEKKLMAQMRLKQVGEGVYEVFSREALSGHGEIAYEGDYIKVDSGGFPYPNSKEFFEANHRCLGGEEYEQIPAPVDVWFLEDGMCAEIQFLIDRKGLTMHPDTPAVYFSAPLWGTVLSAAKDAAIVFYSIERDTAGTITDADFNFVARDEFEKTYRFV